MADNRPKTPRVSLALAPIEISGKEIKVRAELYNSDIERMVRFTLNGATSTDAVKTTDNKNVEHCFQIPPNTTEASMKVETLGEPKAWDEIKIPIAPTTKKKEEKKKHAINIFGPLGGKKVFSILFLGERNQTVELSSRTALSVESICPASAIRTGIHLHFVADDDGKLELLISFKGKDTLIIFTIGRETEKRMLVK